MLETICSVCHNINMDCNTYHQSSMQRQTSWTLCSIKWSVTTPPRCSNVLFCHFSYSGKSGISADIFVLYKILFEYLFSALHHSSVQYRLVIMFPLSIWELLICDNAVLFYPPRLLISDLHTVSRIFTLSDSSNWSPNTHHRVGHYLHNGILMPTHTGSVGWREGREKFI